MVFICDGVSSCDLVGVKDASGTRQAAAHLLSLAHRRVLYLSNPSIEPETARARLQGYRAATCGQTALALVGNISSGKVMVGNEVFELGSLVRDKRVTGVVCVNDSTALEVLDQLERHGLSVPDDVSVVGFDDIAIAGLARILANNRRSAHRDDRRRRGPLAVRPHQRGSARVAKGATPPSVAGGAGHDRPASRNGPWLGEYG